MRKQFAPLVDESAIVQFEEYIGAKLPEDYRDFLLHFNGGEPENTCFTFVNKQGSYTDSVVRYFFSISDMANISLLYKYESYTNANRTPRGTLPIAGDPGGNLVLLKIQEPEKGKVYFWDHELEGLEEEPNSPEHLELVGETFQKFYARLLPED